MYAKVLVGVYKFYLVIRNFNINISFIIELFTPKCMALVLLVFIDNL